MHKLVIFIETYPDYGNPEALLLFLFSLSVGSSPLPLCFSKFSVFKRVLNSESGGLKPKDCPHLLGCQLL